MVFFGSLGLPFSWFLPFVALPLVPVATIGVSKVNKSRGGGLAETPPPPQNPGLQISQRLQISQKLQNAQKLQHTLRPRPDCLRITSEIPERSGLGRLAKYILRSAASCVLHISRRAIRFVASWSAKITVIFNLLGQHRLECYHVWHCRKDMYLHGFYKFSK